MGLKHATPRSRVTCFSDYSELQLFRDKAGKTKGLVYPEADSSQTRGLRVKYAARYGVNLPEAVSLLSCYLWPHIQGQRHLGKVTFHPSIYWDHGLISLRPVRSQSNLNWPCLYRSPRYPYLGNHWIFLVFAKAL